MKYIRSLEYRRPRLVDTFFILILFALYLLRLAPHIGSDGAYFDEGFSSYLARLDPLSIAHYTALDVHPPLYYILLSVWQHIVGFDIGTLRLLSVAWALAAVLAVFLLVRLLLGRRSAYFATLLVSLTPIFIRYGEALRMYTMAMALVLLATYVLARIIVLRPKRIWLLWILYAVVASAALWTNYFALFGFLAHGVWLLVIRKREGNSGTFRQWVFAGIAAFILYLPWLPSLLTRLGSIQSSGFWIPPLSLQTLFSTFTLSTIYRSLAEAGWLLIPAGAYAVVALSVIVRAYRKGEAERRSRMLLLGLVGALPIVGLILISLPPFHPAYVHRYVLTGIVGLAALVGAAAGQLRFVRASRIGFGLVGMVLVGTLLLGGGQFGEVGNRNLDTGAYSTVAQSVAHVEQIGRPSEPIVTYSGYTYFALSLYDTSDHPVWLVPSPDLAKDPTTRVLVERPLHLVTQAQIDGALSYWKLDDVSGAPVHVIQSVKMN